MRSIVECKCYPLETKVGRPQLQKLVGANATKYGVLQPVITPVMRFYM